jgi:zinc and cadmium transporter
MTETYLFIFGSVLIISLVSQVGVLALSINNKVLKSIVFFLVSLSAGALFGDAIIHLIPEALEEARPALYTSLLIIAGILLFFILEKFLHWHHTHGEDTADHEHKEDEEHVHPRGVMILVSDGVHNFLDGLIIASSFMVDIRLGIATTIAVFLHEIPQELGDFGVLIHAGYSRAKALFYNFISAIFAVLGALVIVLIGEAGLAITSIMLPIAAGGFIYIAGSDLIPELQKTTNTKKSVLQFVAMLIGIGAMALLVFLE